VKEGVEAAVKDEGSEDEVGRNRQCMYVLGNLFTARGGCVCPDEEETLNDEDDFAVDVLAVFFG